MASRILITSKRTGLGSDLATVVGAWAYARDTGRALAVDWRRSRYLDDPDANLFFELFDPPRWLAGVEILPEQAVAEASERAEASLSAASEADFLRRLFRSEDLPAEVLSCERTMHVLPGLDHQRAMFSALRPKAEIEQLVETISSSEFGPRRTIGVHVRHGNGEQLKSGREEFTPETGPRVVERIEQLVSLLGADRPKVLVCTDGPELEAELLARLPGAFATDRPRDEAGQGPLHVSRHGLAGARAALVDMLLLARVDILIHNNSWFSHYARIMGKFVLDPVNLDPGSDYGANAYFLRRLAQAQA